ncbi:MAG TPA: hypothetical protein VGE07_19480 [Herpetosiphonaceae bacterium]
MKTVVVVNGESDWQAFLPGVSVRQRWLQSCSWIYQDGGLWVVDREGALRVDGVLWRLGAVRPEPSHRAALELIRLAGVPCVNPAATLLRGYDRLGMLNELKAAGLPIHLATVVSAPAALGRIEPELPAVIKAGNLHGGWGKALLRDRESWHDLRDMLFASEEYVTLEPHVEYVRDIRVLDVGGEQWAMARRGAGWKANVATTHYELIDPPAPLAAMTRRAMEHLGADLLGLDFLETAGGEFVLLESNDIPGLSGFPDAARQTVARIMRERLR